MGDVPGGYFVGRPQQAPAAAAVQEQKPANTQTPGDYFMGTPENLRPSQQQPNQNQSTGDGLKRANSSGPKWACCFGGSEVQN